MKRERERRKNMGVKQSNGNTWHQAQLSYCIWRHVNTMQDIRQEWQPRSGLNIEHSLRLAPVIIWCSRDVCNIHHTKKVLHVMQVIGFGIQICQLRNLSSRRYLQAIWREQTRSSCFPAWFKIVKLAGSSALMYKSAKKSKVSSRLRERERNIAYRPSSWTLARWLQILCHDYFLFLVLDSTALMLFH